MSDISQTNIVSEIQDAYLEYAMSVIVGRALPDVRDGLKPVHRRILYTMHMLNNKYNQSFKKSARIIGEVLGKYHPHGDTAVYDAMVRMAQDFSLRYPLVDGQGNFGSIDGDSPAAMRYTEVRLQKVSDYILQDIEKETVEFAPNYDGTLKEPKLLPTRVPNLLINGSNGIAVGMATNVPPHNLSEVVEALIYLIDHPEAQLEDLLKIIKGPDFPTAGTIYGTKGFHDAYRTGRGVIQVRAKAEIEPIKGNRSAIIVHELPYQVNKANLIQKIADLVRDKALEGISDIRDESSREGMRVVIELRKGETPELLLNQLYKHTQMQTSFGIQLLALINNAPKLFSLKEMLQEFLLYRKEVITKRSLFELRKLQDRIHILEGLIKAIQNIDEVVALIKKSESPKEAHLSLVSTFLLSDIQAKSILDMRLQKLTQLETSNLSDEYNKCQKEAKALKVLLSKVSLIYDVIKTEFIEIKELFGDKRRTSIEQSSVDFNEEDLVTEEDMVITLSHKGYLKKNPLTEYRSQRRGGRGVRGAGVQTEDFIENVFVTGNRNVLLCFSDKGRLYWLKVYRIPMGTKTSRGRPVVNVLNLKSDEKIVSILPISSFEDGRFVFMATKNGVTKKCQLVDFKNIRAGGIIALKCDDGDVLIDAELVSDDDNVCLMSSKGQSIRFTEKDVRCMGRNARGVIGMRLTKGDEIVSMAVMLDDKKNLLTVSSKGYGKRTRQSAFRLQKRGGSGIIAMKTTEKIGRVVSCLKVRPEDGLMLVTNQGQMIRIPVDGISSMSRNTQGVKLIGVKENEQVVSVALADATFDDQEDI